MKNGLLNHARQLSPDLCRVLSTNPHAKAAFMAAEHDGKPFVDCLIAAIVQMDVVQKNQFERLVEEAERQERVYVIDGKTMRAVDSKPKMKLDILPPTEERMQRLAKAAEEAIEAQGLLRKAGYGWSGLSLLETVKLVVAEKEFELVQLNQVQRSVDLEATRFKASIGELRDRAITLDDGRRLRCHEIVLVTTGAYDPSALEAAFAAGARVEVRLQPDKWYAANVERRKQ